ncbi:hypothetical protein EYC80_010649 [Monilinia laxa]|nr:hypothetical protein EYC80_010649 [Monilinia laxa]
MRPRRDSTGNTNGFVRPVRKVAEAIEKKAAISDGANSENGEERTNEVTNENMTSGANTSGSPVGKKRSRRSKADPSNTFVRRSSRRVGGSVERIDDLVLNEVLGENKEEGSSSLSGSSLSDRVDVDTPTANTMNNASNAPSPVEQNIILGGNEQGVSVGGMDEVEDHGGSNGMIYSIVGHTIPRSPPAASDTIANIPNEARLSRPRIKLLLTPRASANKTNRHDPRRLSPKLLPAPSTPPKNTNFGPSSSLYLLPPSTPPNHMNNARRIAQVPFPPASTSWPSQFLAPAISSSNTNGTSFPPFPPPGTYAPMRTNGGPLSPYQEFMQSNVSSPRIGNGMPDSRSTGNAMTTTFPPPFNPFYPPTASYRSPYGPLFIPDAINQDRHGSNSTITAPDIDDVFNSRPQADGHGENEEMQESQAEVLPSANEILNSDPSELFEESLDLIEMATSTPKIGDRVRLAGEQSSPLYQGVSSDDMDWQA